MVLHAAVQAIVLVAFRAGEVIVFRLLLQQKHIVASGRWAPGQIFLVGLHAVAETVVQIFIEQLWSKVLAEMIY